MKSLTTLRVTVESAGRGMGGAHASVVSAIDGPLHLHVPSHLLDGLAALVGRDVDAELELDRHETGGGNGRLLAFHVVEDGDAAAAWGAWHKAVSEPRDDAMTDEDDLAAVEEFLTELPPSRIIERYGFEAKRDELLERIAARKTTPAT